MCHSSIAYFSARCSSCVQDCCSIYFILLSIYSFYCTWNQYCNESKIKQNKVNASLYFSAFILSNCTWNHTIRVNELACSVRALPERICFHKKVTVITEIKSLITSMWKPAAHCVSLSHRLIFHARYSSRRTAVWRRLHVGGEMGDSLPCRGKGRIRNWRS